MTTTVISSNAPIKLGVCFGGTPVVLMCDMVSKAQLGNQKGHSIQAYK